MPSSLSAAIDGLLPVMQRGDLAGFQQIFSRLHRDGRGLPPDELTAAVGELAPVLARRPEGVFARLALTAGAFVEWGGSALPLAANAPACTLLTMLLRARFSELWPAASGERPEPGLEQAPSMADLIGVFAGAAGRLGLSERQATSIALAWFDVGHWVNLMITVMARREFRDAAGLLPQIGDAAAGLEESVLRAHWLPGLARVLDDESVVVIDDATGRGFRLTMSDDGTTPARCRGHHPAPVPAVRCDRRLHLPGGSASRHPPCRRRPRDRAPSAPRQLRLGRRPHLRAHDPGPHPRSRHDSQRGSPWRARIAPARETDLFGKTSQT